MGNQPSDEVVERVAVALEREFPECIDEGRMGFVLRLARAAIAAAQSDGVVGVSDEMVERGARALAKSEGKDMDRDGAVHFWRSGAKAVLLAALSAPEPVEEQKQ